MEIRVYNMKNIIDGGIKDLKDSIAKFEQSLKHPGNHSQQVHDPTGRGGGGLHSSSKRPSVFEQISSKKRAGGHLGLWGKDIEATTAQKKEYDSVYSSTVEAISNLHTIINNDVYDVGDEKIKRMVDFNNKLNDFNDHLINKIISDSGMPYETYNKTRLNYNSYNQYTEVKKLAEQNIRIAETNISDMNQFMNNFPFTENKINIMRNLNDRVNSILSK